MAYPFEPEIRPSRSRLSESSRRCESRGKNSRLWYVSGRVHLRPLQDRWFTIVARSLDVSGKRRVRAIHPGERRLAFRSRSLRNLFLWQAAVLRAQQRREW